jgi:neutral ceramidase
MNSSHNRRRRVFFVLLVCLGVNMAAQAAPRQFRAGAAASNITPELGQPVVGGWSPLPATHVHDELHARALVLDDGTTRLAIVVSDNVGISQSVLDEAKRLAHEATGIPVQNMLMSSSHTHSATSAGRGAGGEALGGYGLFLAKKISEAVRRAFNNLEPAEIGWGKGQEPTPLNNRRWFMKPGTPLPDPFGGEDKVVMNPRAGDPNLLKPAGPTDPEVSFLSVRTPDGRPIALLANYSLHYVGGVPQGHISADYFAIFAQRIGQMIGAEHANPPFVGIMSNGTSGDVNNIDFSGRRKSQPPYSQMNRVANAVAAEVYRAYQYIEHRDWVPLGAATHQLELSTRVPTAKQLDWAREVQARPENAPQRHIRERNYAERVLRMKDTPDVTKIPVQAMRIGDLAITAIPFEVFTEIGLELKQKNPFPASFTISIANGSNGYLPTPEQHQLGGYETWLGTSRFEVEASTKITRKLLDLLQQLRSTPVASD